MPWVVLKDRSSEVSISVSRDSASRVAFVSVPACMAAEAEDRIAMNIASNAVAMMASETITSIMVNARIAILIGDRIRGGDIFSPYVDVDFGIVRGQRNRSFGPGFGGVEDYLPIAICES